MNEGQGRMHGVDKMDTVSKVSGRKKLEIWKEVGWGLYQNRGSGIQKNYLLTCLQCGIQKNYLLTCLQCGIQENYLLTCLQCGITGPEGWEDGREICTLTSKLSSLGLNLSAAINCHPSVSQAGQFINVCAILRWMSNLCHLTTLVGDVKDPTVSFTTSWLAIASTVDKLNSKFLLKPIEVFASVPQQYPQTM